MTGVAKRGIVESVGRIRKFRPNIKLGYGPEKKQALLKERPLPEVHGGIASSMRKCIEDAMKGPHFSKTIFFVAENDPMVTL